MATSSRGTTLLEMMITLVMVAILATVGYPSFSHYLRQSRRVQAQTDLLTLQLRQEEYYLKHGVYAPSLGALKSPANPYYDYRLQGSDHDYRITATARASGGQQGDRGCTTMGLDRQRHQQPAECW